MMLRYRVAGGREERGRERERGLDLEDTNT